jgi:ferric-dicitrate binding protein FerR (iron transport regulator)
MNNSTIIAIIEKYGAGPLSAEEETILDAWLDSVPAEEFHQTLDRCENLPARFRDYPAISREFTARLEASLNEQDISAEIPTDRVSTDRVIPWKKWTAIAAAVLLVFSAGTYLWIAHRTLPPVGQASVTFSDDVAPGLDGAILTLANGKKIVLDSAKNGSLATDGNTTITKLSNGQLAYAASPDNSGELLYNTLTTPRGRKTSLVLTDGTRVWLNAASSIKYPTSFGDKDRTVEITGEAYFEVAGNASKPFVVKKAGSDYRIQVLGTHFNVNAYDDEDAIRTTLLEGSVSVMNGKNNKLLKPGQQAVTGSGNDGTKVLTDANMEEAMAWKLDKFSFDRADIHTVMRQIARWYDVNVEYKGTINQHFGGTISRDVNVSKVFQMLELTGAVKFTIEGRNIQVNP